MWLTPSRLAGAAAVAAAALAPAPAAAAPAVAAAGPARVAVRHTALGTILVNGHGFTLYAFGRDRRGVDRCVHISGCAGAWPVLVTKVPTTLRALGGVGVRRPLLGSIALPGGGRQVTYAGHPLYTYAFDSGPGQTSYVGAVQFGGRWSAVRPSGKLVG